MPGMGGAVVEQAPVVTGGAVVARGRWARFPSTRMLWPLLLLITGVGAFLRFWRIDQQSYWTDESHTIVRINGTWNQMLASLSTQGFPPGWYCLLRWWTMLVESWTGSGAYAFSPAATRLPGAALGALTVPGLYFLARQFTDRKGALLVMLLGAVNPFLVYYSRDIKMYPAMWCFLVWHVALFFKWQTTHRHVLWFPLWVLTGAAMTAMHSMSFFIVGLELVFLLTRPRLRPLDGPLWLTGAGVMSLLPIYWYLHRTNWIEQAVDQGSLRGLDWITLYTDMSWRTVASLPCSHVLGYLYPVYPPDGRIISWFGLGYDFNKQLGTRSLPWLASAELWVAAVVGAIMVLGLVPWRGMRRSAEREASVTRGRWWWVLIWIVVPSVCLALTWIPESSPWHGRIWGSLHPSRIWEPRYLGIIVPAWLLWLGASLRRLPTWPVRTLAIVFVVAVCTASSLSNHLIYRQAPWQRTAEAMRRYYDPKKPGAMALGWTQTAFPHTADVMHFQIAAGMRPEGEGAWFPESGQWSQRLTDNINDSRRGDSYEDFVRRARLGGEVSVIVLTDRLGDEVAKADGTTLHRISDIEMDKLLNDRRAQRNGYAWKLVSEETYRWYYEWRFYIFHTWRTRVWVRQAVASPGAGASATTSASAPAATAR
jgi:hypothetical protein